MNMPIIHYAERILYDNVRVLCQIPCPQHVTQDTKRVTCKRCLRVLGSVKGKAMVDV